MEGKEQYQVKISNRFAVLENSDDGHQYSLGNYWTEGQNFSERE
jgi:hypothetical protein